MSKQTQAEEIRAEQVLAGPRQMPEQAQAEQVQTEPALAGPSQALAGPPAADLKVIFQTGAIKEPDDPSYPWRLDLNFRPPEFMNVAFISLYGGSEEIIVRGRTREILEAFVAENKFRTHPRLCQLTITGPDGAE